MQAVVPAGRGATPESGSQGSWLAWLPLACVFFMLAVLSIRQVGSLDIGFHLKAGEQILSGGGWPGNDTFTFTVNDHPYIDTSWGYQVAGALANRSFGPAGIVLFHAGLIAGTFLLILLTARLGRADPGTLAVSLLAGAIASEMRFEARPELASYLCLAAVLLILHRRAEGLASPLWLLPVISLLWANTHSLFILGWAAIGCFLAGTFLSRLITARRFDWKFIDSPLAGFGALSVLVTAINPYGLRGVVFPFTLATRLQAENPFAQTIGEFVSPLDLALGSSNPFYPQLPIWTFRALLAVSILALWPLIRSGRTWYVLLWIAFAPLAIKMIRNMPLLVIVLLPGMIRAFPIGEWIGARRRGMALALRWSIAAAAVVLSLRVVHDGYYISTRRLERFGLGWNSLELPTEAADYARSAGLSGRVLNHLNLGGWLMHALPGPVFIDGRLEVMGERFFNEYRQALSSADALEACVSRYGIRWMVFPFATSPDLLGRVSRDARWRLAHADQLAVVFVRAEPGASMTAVPAFGPGGAPAVPPPPVAPLLRSLPGLYGNPRPGKASHWLESLVRREEFPSKDYSLGIFDLYRGDLDGAAARFSSAIAASGGAYYEIYNNLGSALYRQKRFEEARECYLVVLQEDPGNPFARTRSVVTPGTQGNR